MLTPCAQVDYLASTADGVYKHKPNQYQVEKILICCSNMTWDMDAVCDP